MWQVYSFGSMLAGACESATDKAGVISGTAVDSYVATFVRTACFFIATVLVGLTGIIGELHFFWHWSIVFVALLGIISSLSYTYVLRRVEITEIVAAGYLASFLYLCIDTQILGVAFSTSQIWGVILLICGGIAFTLDGKTHRFQKNLTPAVIGAFLMMYVVYGGIDAYLFKYLNTTIGLNGVSFYASIWLIGLVFFFGLLLVKGRVRLLFSKQTAHYVPYAALGKSFDVFNSVWYATALSIATVSQVSAFNSLLPLLLFFVAAISQKELHVRLKEQLDPRRAPWKLGAVITLLVGGILVS